METQNTETQNIETQNTETQNTETQNTETQNTETPITETQNTETPITETQNTVLETTQIFAFEFLDIWYNDIEFLETCIYTIDNKELLDALQSQWIIVIQVNNRDVLTFQKKDDNSFIKISTPSNLQNPAVILDADIMKYTENKNHPLDNYLDKTINIPKRDPSTFSIQLSKYQENSTFVINVKDEQISNMLLNKNANKLFNKNISRSLSCFLLTLNNCSDISKYIGRSGNRQGETLNLITFTNSIEEPDFFKGFKVISGDIQKDVDFCNDTKKLHLIDIKHQYFPMNSVLNL